MEEKYKKYLPLGTLVKIDDNLKRVMIIGFCIKIDNDPNKIYDYMGCIYPEGILKTTEFFTFDHSDIKQICALGYSDQEEKDFKAELNKKVKDLEI